MRFKDTVVLITGGSGGIGAAAARLFAEEGARIAITGRDPQRTQAVAEQTGAFLASTADITRPAHCTQLIQDVYEKGQGLDILVNNAGMIIRADTAETTDDEWYQILDLNLSAPFFLSRQAVQVMRKQQRGGAIVHVSSINGVIGRKTLMAYSATKGALIQMTQSMALDCAQDNIRVNVVCPGATDTPMPFSQHAQAVSREEMEGRWKDLIPMQRMGTPEEIARSILFLASPDASYITGTQLLVDGGVTSG